VLTRTLDVDLKVLTSRAERRVEEAREEDEGKASEIVHFETCKSRRSFGDPIAWID